MEWNRRRMKGTEKGKGTSRETEPKQETLTRRRAAKGIFSSEEQRQTDIIDSHRYRRERMDVR